MRFFQLVICFATDRLRVATVQVSFIKIDLYKQYKGNNNESWASLQTNSVNRKFIQDFREELRFLFSKFDELSNQQEYIGEIRVSFGALFNRYLDDFDNKGERLQ